MTSLFDSAIGIDGLRQEYKLNTFVETGCYQGEGLHAAKLAGYRKLLSCDINQVYVDHCHQYFDEADIRLNKSTEFFKETLPNVGEKTLFWLDAHYPKYYGVEDDLDAKFPLIDELKLIKEHKKNYQQDVIICDDLRVLAPDDNPFYAGGLDPYFLTEYTIKQIVEMFSDTHNHKLLSIDTGVLILTPKHREVNTRILINRQMAAGDVLLVEPIVRHLHESRNGQCTIDVCTSPNNFHCISHSPLVNKVVDRLNIFDYDMFINLDSAYEKYPNMHIVDAYANYVFGPNQVVNKIPVITTNDEDKSVAKYLKENYNEYIVVHMRNNTKELDSRNINADIWQKFIQLVIQNSSLNIVVVGTLYDHCFPDADGRVIDMREAMNLRQLKEVIATAKVFVGADSMPSHVASSTDTPLIGLFTSVEAELRLAANRPNTYPIKANIECYGCRKNLTPPVYGSNCKRGDVECTRRFDANEIFQQVIKIC